MSVENNRVVQYAASKGWNFRTTEDHLIVEDCPICGKSNYHFYLRFAPKEKEGLWDCKSCGENGNFYQLREYLGDKLESVTSVRDVAVSRQASPLPDVSSSQAALAAEAEDPSVENSALDYLLSRGYTMEVIDRMKLGLVSEYGKRWIIYPYYHKENLIYAKYRTIPPEEKEMRGISGRECPLYNQDALQKDMEQLVLCEGEGDTLSCLSKGVDYAVGIPGANVKKASWIRLLDNLQPKNIYILYDNDRVGQDAAKDMASRIGIDKVKNIVLPEFKWTDENDVEHDGKDINDWWRAGHTIEDFEQLKAEAKKFDIDGVYSAADVIEDLRQRLLDGGSLEPKWKASGWESLNKLIKGYEPGDLIGLLAVEKVGKTSMVENILDWLNTEYNESVFLFCQEMQPPRLVRKWISIVTNTNDADITLQTIESALAIAASRDADYLFGYTTSVTRKEVFDTIRQVVRRYGVKFVAFDNLQVLSRSIDHTAQEICNTANEFKALAMELGIVIFLVMQPHQLRDGEIVSSRNVYGSSAPTKAVDAMICLHRNMNGNIKEEDFQALGFLEVAEAYGPELLVRVDRSRYSAGGATTLYFDGAKSKVVEMTQQQVQQKQSLMPVDPAKLIPSVERVAA